MALLKVNWKPSRRELRQFAGIWFPAFFAVVGGLILRHTGSWVIPAAIWSATLAVSVIGFLFPSFIRPIFLGLIILTWPIGWALSHLMLAATYYLMITPVALTMRLFGYDPMKRRIERSTSSYWVAHNPGDDPQRYFRQL